ncbi:hypothetical protein SGRIM128S_02615 [Streptomyces griseomycini]
MQSIAAPAVGKDDAPGRFNNVDLLHGLRLSSGKASLAVTSDRGHDRLRFYRIDRDRTGGPLTDVTDPASPPVFSQDQAEINDQRTAYGLATWTDPATGKSYALVSRRERTGIALPGTAADRRRQGHVPQDPHPGPPLHLPAARRHLVVPVRRAR